MDSLSIEHQKELLEESAIAPEIAALNFCSFDGTDENELDRVFTQLIEEPAHNNNGTLSGTYQNDLANAIRGGGWIFKGHRGICIKPDNPRTDKDGKVIKYESPRGQGKLQIFIPTVSIGAGLAIATKHGLEQEYRARIEKLLEVNVIDYGECDRSREDTGFWEWFLTTKLPIILTEGAKKACSLISNGYPAIALNGVWGWGTNDKDVFGNVEKDDRGKSIKTIHPELEPFLDGRELILAFDRDTNPDTIKKVEAAKSALIRAIDADDIVVTDLKWRTPKGIDDYLAAKGVKSLDRLYANRKEVKPAKPQKEERVTSGDTLIEIGRTATYFHTADKVAYADVSIDGNRVGMAVRSRAFRLWLTGEYFKRMAKGVSAQPLQDTLNTLEAIALFDGETREVALRTAEYQGKIYLDLGTTDWKAVEIDPTGWRLVNDPPVRFWRPDSLLPLPYPVEGGKLSELRDLLNVDDSSWVQIVTFLLFCYLPNKRYPVLVLSAIRGSGKTTAAEIIKGLIDPGKAPLIPLPSNTRDLAVAAFRRWLMVYDNVSHISNDESDNLCKLSTGFGFTARKLHTDDDETTIECTRPQIVTAIDGVVAREDLGDRVLLATLGEITPDRRLSASELERKIYDSRPSIFGALLTALSQALAKLPQTQIAEPPRMADYALFSVAAEGALGLEDGAFLTAFGESRDRVREVVIESSPLGEAILSLMRDKLVWKGSASELLSALGGHVDDSIYRSRFFPKAANQLKAKLNRLSPDLRSMGIDVKDGVRSSNRDPRSIVLEKVVKVSSTSSTNPNKSPEPRQEEGLLVDDPIEANRPLSSTNSESIVHSSSTNPNKSPEPRQGEGSLVDYPIEANRPLSSTNSESIVHSSSTDEVSSTNRPLTEPCQDKGLDCLVDDVDDVDDTFGTYSGNDRIKVNSDNPENDKVDTTPNFQNHNFSTSWKLSSPDGEIVPVENSSTEIESEVIDCEDF
jgi:Domain of unknown function (DUF3854)